MSWRFAYEAGNNGPWLICFNPSFTTLEGSEQMSVACWFQDTDFGSNNDRTLFSFGRTTQDWAGFRLGKVQSAPTVAIDREGDVGGYQVATTSNEYLPDRVSDNTKKVWNHAMAVVYSDGVGESGTVWTNGLESGKSSLASAHSITGIDFMAFGCEGDSSPSDSWHGLIGCFCMWYDYALTRDDRARLARGEHPLSLTHILDKIVIWEPLDKPYISNEILSERQSIFTVGAYGTGANPVYDTEEPPVFWPTSYSDFWTYPFESRQFNPVLHPPKDDSFHGSVIPAKNIWTPELFEANKKPDIELVEIDWNRSITTDLISYGLGLYDLVPEENLFYYSNKADIKGDWLHFNDTRASETILLSHLGNNWLDGAQALTIFIRCRLHGASHDDEDCLFGQHSQLQGGNTNESRRCILRYKSNVPHLEFKLYEGSDSNHVVSQDLDDGKFHDIVARLKGGVQEMWVDGLRIGTTTAFTGPIDNTSHSKVPEVMGGHSSTGSSVLDSPRFDLHSWGLWDRGLENGEIYDLSKYGSIAQILKPKGPAKIPIKKGDFVSLPDPRFENVDLFEPHRQPDPKEIEIDWTLPITEGMNGIYVFSDAKHNKDLSGKQKHLTLNGASYIMTEKGVTLVTTDGDYADIADFQPTSNTTIITWIKATTDDAVNMRMWGSQNAYESRWLSAQGDKVSSEYGIVTQTVEEGWSAGALNFDQWYMYAPVQSFDLDIIKTYLDGVEENDDSGAGHHDEDPATFYTSAIFRLGNRQGSVDTDAFKGQLGGFFYIWDRHLTPGEIQDIYVNPYHFFIPK